MFTGGILFTFYLLKSIVKFTFSKTQKVQGVVTGMLFTAAAGFLTLAGVGVYTFLSGRNKDEENKKEKQQRVQAITN